MAKKAPAKKLKVISREVPIKRQSMRGNPGVPRRSLENVPQYDVANWVPVSRAVEIVKEWHSDKYPDFDNSTLLTWIASGYIQSFVFNKCGADLRLVSLEQMIDIPTIAKGRGSKLKSIPTILALPEEIELTMVKRTGEAPVAIDGKAVAYPLKTEFFDTKSEFMPYYENPRSKCTPLLVYESDTWATIQDTSERFGLGAGKEPIIERVVKGNIQAFKFPKVDTTMVNIPQYCDCRAELPRGRSFVDVPTVKPLPDRFTIKLNRLPLPKLVYGKHFGSVGTKFKSKLKCVRIEDGHCQFINGTSIDDGKHSLFIWRSSKKFNLEMSTERELSFYDVHFEVKEHVVCQRYRQTVISIHSIERSTRTRLIGR